MGSYCLLALARFLVYRNSPVAGRYGPPYWQGFRVRTEQGMGCV